MEDPNRIRELREAKGWSQERLADEVGTSQPQIRRLESGQRRLTADWMRRLARALSVGQADLLPDSTQEVAVAGYVGAGQEVIPFDAYPPGEGLHKVAVPAHLGTVVGVEVRGDSMWPRYADGEIVLYDRQTSDPRELVNRECIISLSDGRLFLKILRRGSSHGRFNLESPNAPILEDQEVEWAAQVKWPTRLQASRSHRF